MIYAVFIGGGLGAVLRYILSVLFSKAENFLPYQTLIANFLGCLIAGCVIAIISSKQNISPLYKGFLITGICGGLTTFSTFSLETVNYIQTGEWQKALIYTLLSIIICILSVAIGIFFIKKTFID